MATAMLPTPNFVVVPAPERPQFYSKYASKSSFVLGGVQIGVGILVAVVPLATGGAVGFLFLGILAVAAGICGVAAGKVKKSCQIIGFMVLSIIVAVIAVLIFIIYASLAGDRYYHHAVHYVLLILFLIESIASIWSAAICCRCVCCGRRLTTGPPVQYQVQTGQVMVTMANPAQMPQQQQPAVPDMVLPPYPGLGATAPAANSAYCNEAYGEVLPPKY